MNRIHPFLLILLLTLLFTSCNMPSMAPDAGEEGTRFSSETVTVVAHSDTETPQPTPIPEDTKTPVATSTDAPTNAPTETETITPSPTECSAAVTFIQNANCRSGPSTRYEVVTSLLEGETVAVEGRNLDRSWWWVQLNNSWAHCWVSDVTVETMCIPDDLPFIASEPVIEEPTFSTDVFNWGGCDLHEVDISVPVFSESPVTEVDIYFRLKDKVDETTTDWTSLPMASNEDGSWTITLSANGDVPGANTFMENHFLYYFVATNDADLSGQSETFGNISLNKCP